MARRSRTTARGAGGARFCPPGRPDQREAQHRRGQQRHAASRGSRGRRRRSRRRPPRRGGAGPQVVPRATTSGVPGAGVGPRRSDVPRRPSSRGRAHGWSTSRGVSVTTPRADASSGGTAATGSRSKPFAKVTPTSSERSAPHPARPSRSQSDERRDRQPFMCSTMPVPVAEHAQTMTSAKPHRGEEANAPARPAHRGRAAHPPRPARSVRQIGRASRGGLADAGEHHALRAALDDVTPSWKRRRGILDRYPGRCAPRTPHASGFHLGDRDEPAPAPQVGVTRPSCTAAPVTVQQHRPCRPTQHPHVTTMTSRTRVSLITGSSSARRPSPPEPRSRAPTASSPPPHHQTLDDITIDPGPVEADLTLDVTDVPRSRPTIATTLQRFGASTCSSTTPATARWRSRENRSRPPTRR